MIEVRKFGTLGHVDHGGLDVRHHFSCADHQDPERTGWGALCAWNDSRIAARSGLPSREHRGREVITYILAGAITLRDSMGNSSRAAAGDVQVLSSGSGIARGEFNFEDEDAALFQIWIESDQTGRGPCWGTRRLSANERSDAFVPLASGIEGDDALPIRANARVAAAILKAGARLRYEIEAGRHAYLVSAQGRVRVNGEEAGPRDGVAIRDVRSIDIEAIDDTELVLVDSA